MNSHLFVLYLWSIITGSHFKKNYVDLKHTINLKLDTIWTENKGCFLECALQLLRPRVLVLRHHYPSTSGSTQEQKNREDMKIPGSFLDIKDASNAEVIAIPPSEFILPRLPGKIRSSKIFYYKRKEQSVKFNNNIAKIL